MEKTAIEQVATAFEEFKAANDNRLKEIEKKGAADVVTAEKVERIEAAIAKFEDANQKLTASILEAKKKADEEVKHVDEIEEKLAKLELRGGTSPDANVERKKRHDTWARSVVLAHTNGVANLTTDQQKLFKDSADGWAL